MLFIASSSLEEATFFAGFTTSFQRTVLLVGLGTVAEEALEVPIVAASTLPLMPSTSRCGTAETIVVAKGLRCFGGEVVVVTIAWPVVVKEPVLGAAVLTPLLLLWLFVAKLLVAMNLDDGGGFLDGLNEDALADDWVLFLANGTL